MLYKLHCNIISIFFIIHDFLTKDLNFRKHNSSIYICNLWLCNIASTFFVRFYIPISVDFATVLERLQIFKGICILIDGAQPKCRHVRVFSLENIHLSHYKFSNHAIISSLIYYADFEFSYIKCMLHFASIRTCLHVCICREIEIFELLRVLVC